MGTYNNFRSGMDQEIILKEMRGSIVRFWLQIILPAAAVGIVGVLVYFLLR